MPIFRTTKSVSIENDSMGRSVSVPSDTSQSIISKKNCYLVRFEVIVSVQHKYLGKAFCLRKEIT